MNYEQKSDIEQAFRMLLETVNFDSLLKVEDVRLMNTLKSSRGVLLVRLSPTHGDLSLVAQTVVNFKQSLARLCFKFYQQRGILLEPKVELVEPTLEDANAIP